MIARSGNSTSPLLNFINDVVENASEFPGDLRDLSERVNRDIISDLTRQQVEENLRQGEFTRIADKSASWLSKPMNLILTVVGVVGLALLFKRL